MSQRLFRAPELAEKAAEAGIVDHVEERLASGEKLFALPAERFHFDPDIHGRVVRGHDEKGDAIRFSLKAGLLSGTGTAVHGKGSFQRGDPSIKRKRHQPLHFTGKKYIQMGFHETPRSQDPSLGSYCDRKYKLFVINILCVFVATSRLHEAIFFPRIGFLGAVAE